MSNNFIDNSIINDFEDEYLILGKNDIGEHVDNKYNGEIEKGELQNKLDNPFFMNNNSVENNLNYRQIMEEYNTSVFVLCLKDNIENNDGLSKIFNYKLTSDDMLNIVSSTELINVSPQFLYLNKNRLLSRAMVIDSDLLLKYYDIQKNLNNDIGDNIIVLPMINYNINHISLINTLLYNNIDINVTLDLINILNDISDKNEFVNTQINTLLEKILSLDEKFWTKDNNCDLNLTRYFVKRNYDNTLNKINQGGVGDLLDNDNDNNDNNDELDNINNDFEGKNRDDDESEYNGTYQIPNREHINLRVLLNKNDKRIFYATNLEKLTLTKEYLKLLFEILDEKQQYLLLHALISSKDYCHLILNNKELLEFCAPLFEKYKSIVRYSLGYGWLSLYTEECIFKTRVTKNNRCVFDIDTASKLPLFPVTYKNLKLNPYFTLLVNDKNLNFTNESIEPLLDYNNIYGTCDMNEFQRRYNIFTTGNEKYNLFDGLNWDKFAVSGSIIPACVQKGNPLLKFISLRETDNNRKWKIYFDTYYGNSDIDLMCNEPKILNFMDCANNVYETLKNNIGNYFGEDMQNKLKVNYIEALSIMITPYYKKHFTDDFINNISADDIKNIILNNGYYANKDRDNKNDDDKETENKLLEKLYEFYLEEKNKLNGYLENILDISTMNLIQQEYFKNRKIEDMRCYYLDKYIPTKDEYMTRASDSEICYFINDFKDVNNRVPESENYLVIKINENIRIKFSHPLVKTTELFRCKGNDFFNVVAKFHLPCVRAYYQGNNVYMLPSFITSMMLGLNIDVKIFMGASSASNILNKYSLRGYGTILNDKEYRQYNNNLENKIRDENLNKFLSINKIIYEDTLMKTYNSEYDNINNIVIKNDELNIFNFRTIDAYGNVVPYYYEVINLYYKKFNRMDKLRTEKEQKEEERRRKLRY